MHVSAVGITHNTGGNRRLQIINIDSNKYIDSRYIEVCHCMRNALFSDAVYVRASSKRTAIFPAKCNKPFVQGLKYYTLLLSVLNFPSSYGKRHLTLRIASGFKGLG